MRPVFPLGILLALSPGRPAFPQGNHPTLQQILRAEDHRARSGADLALLERGLTSPDTLVLGRSLRALGRLEQPALAPRLLPFMDDLRAGVRAEAVQAVAQAVQGYRRDSLAARGAVWDSVLQRLEARSAV